MQLSDQFIEIRNRNDHRCFGCGPGNPSGLKMRFFSDQESLVSCLRVPGHLCGWDNLVHGGVITTMLDEIMSWSAIYLLKKMILTKKISVEFMKPILIETDLMVQGRVLRVEGNREAVVEGCILDEKKSVRATAKGTFALLKPKIAKRLGIMSAEALEGFQAIMDG